MRLRFVFHKPVTEVLEGFSFEKNPKASGKKESSQPKGKASEKSKRTHFTFVL
jgi:hypothetical protein